MTMVFLGGVSEVIGAGIKLTRFGERIELPDDIAEGCLHPRGLPCIPAEEFDAIGFSDADLKKYGPAASHASAPEDFLQKKRVALGILQASREGK